MRLLSSLYGVIDRAGRAVGMEREHLEDLLAEARAKYEMDRARAARQAQDRPHGAPTAVPVQDRAA